MSVPVITRPGPLPPGPRDEAHLRTLRDDPLGFVTAMAREHGPVSSHRTGGDLVFMLSRPELARHVLRDNGAAYSKVRTPDDAMLRPLLGNGLLTSSGEDWARQRRLCAPAFRPAEVTRFDGIITAATDRMVERWEAAGDAPVDVDRVLTSLTLTVLVRAILGADVDGVGDGFGRAVDAVNRYIGHFVPDDDPDPADTRSRRVGFAQARAFLDSVCRTLVAARRAGAGPADSHDLLDALLGADGAVSDVELRDQVLTLVMAGHETTAKALTWTLYLLDRNPDQLARVQDEVDRVLGGRLPTAADVADLPFTRAAIDESMRLFPPVWMISRRAVQPDEIDGWGVPAGTLMCVSQWVLHRHPEFWERPDRFEPERFLPGAPALPSHLYLPFGGGDRICIGKHLALIEATLVLATVVSRLRLRLVPGFPVEPEALVTLRPKHGLRMTVSPR